MNKIELTELEESVLRKDLAGDFSLMTASQDELAAMSSVIEKADNLMTELDAYDELGDSLMKWFWNKYLVQKAEEAKAEA